MCFCFFFVIGPLRVSGRVPGKREVPCGRRLGIRACLRVDGAWERSGLGMLTEFAFLVGKGGGGEYGCLVMVVELAALRAVYGTAHMPVYRSKRHFFIGFHPIVVNRSWQMPCNAAIERVAHPLERRGLAWRPVSPCCPHRVTSGSFSGSLMHTWFPEIIQAV